MIESIVFSYTEYEVEIVKGSQSERFVGGFCLQDGQESADISDYKGFFQFYDSKDDVYLILPIDGILKITAIPTAESLDGADLGG